jgi:hypothetical protein
MTTEVVDPGCQGAISSPELGNFRRVRETLDILLHSPASGMLVPLKLGDLIEKSARVRAHSSYAVPPENLVVFRPGALLLHLRARLEPPGNRSPGLSTGDAAFAKSELYELLGFCLLPRTDEYVAECTMRPVPDSPGRATILTWPAGSDATLMDGTDYAHRASIDSERHKIACYGVVPRWHRE